MLLIPLLKKQKGSKRIMEFAKTLPQSDDKFIDFIQANNKEERQLSSLDLSEVIEESYREIFEELKNELKHRNLDSIIRVWICPLWRRIRDWFDRRTCSGFFFQESKAR